MFKQDPRNLDSPAIGITAKRRLMIIYSQAFDFIFILPKHATNKSATANEATR